MKRLLLSNGFVLVILYSVWFLGWYTEETKTVALDRVLFWLAFPGFYVASFFAFRGRYSKAVIKSLASAVVFLLTLWILVFISVPIFGPRFDPWF